jgi:uncharacterized protein
VIDPELLPLLVCPITRGPLIYDEAANELISEKAGVAYPVRSNVPILIIEEARILVDQTSTP